MTTNISNFTETRAGDRKKMTAILEKVVTDNGGTFVREEGGTYPGPHVIQLRVSTPRGLQVLVDLDGKSPQPNVHVLSWHMHGAYWFDEINEATFGGRVNSCHYQKATYVARGFEDLCQQLGNGIRMAVSGEAFYAGKGKNIPELLFLWDKLGDIPVTEDGALTDEAFLQFPAGTPCEDIWHWFESQNPRFTVGEVMQGIRPASDAKGKCPETAANPPEWTPAHWVRTNGT